MSDANAVDQVVLDEIQSGFPLVHDPYGLLAQKVGLTRSEVIEAVARLRTDGTIRRIGASFSSRHLGYVSTLCALAVSGSADEVDRVAAIVSEFPEVTHNYLRNAEYNVWFTLIASSHAEIGRVLAQVRSRTGCDDMLNLPAKKLYKACVDFSGKARAPESRAETSDPFDVNDPFDVRLVQWAQGDVLGERPFVEFGHDEERALARLRSWVADGTIRRFGAIVRHQRMGYVFNGMTLWNVPDADVERIGCAFSAFPFVSHCYERPRVGSWDYNLYSMVHAKTQRELDAYVGEMRALTGLDSRVLVSSKEYKKASPWYFAS